jgi:SOS regulatory protein LexA
MVGDGQYLEALRAYYGQHGVLPSYATIGRLVGMSSKASVAEMVERLKQARYLDSTPDRRLRPGRRFHDREVADHVRAGQPSSGSDVLTETLSLDSYVTRNRHNTVLVRVKGDSMIDAGILEGDIVVVTRRPDARTGQIVVAIIDGDFTLKRLAIERGRPVLRAENSAYSSLRPRGGFEVFGVVVGLVRRYP